ncbi:MAG: CapA family protein [Melioribacteraceae bacterium]|nr:CapA family protein [Melioribacteraceae bacterium]
MTHNKFLIIAILVFITASGLSFFFQTNSYFKKDNLFVEKSIKNSDNEVAVSNNLIEQTKRFFIDKKETATSKDLSLNEIKVLFVGDIMMDRYIRKQGERFGYDFHFACAAPTFKKYDFVVANFESTVTNYPSVSFDKTLPNYNNFKFTVDPVALVALKNAGINVVGVDNNHIYDHGKEGVDLTRQNILARGLNYFGDPIDSNYYNLRLEKNGIAFNLVSYNEFFGSVDKTLKNIEKANSNEPIIIFSHWGDEYVPTPDRVKNWAHVFIDNGADLIIGMHPHVVQETETYQNKFIAYSLGNFLFDQYFSPEVQKGGVVEMILNKDGIISTRFLNVSLDIERRPCIQE